jgi:hypothetical protein
MTHYGTVAISKSPKDTDPVERNPVWRKYGSVGEEPCAEKDKKCVILIARSATI